MVCSVNVYGFMDICLVLGMLLSSYVQGFFWFSRMHGMYAYMDGVNSNLSLEVAMKLVTNSFLNIDKSIELHVGNRCYSVKSI